MNVSQDGPSNSDLGSTETVTRFAIVPWLLGVGGVAALTAVATAVAVRDDGRGALSLELLTPVVYLIEHRPDVATDFELLEDC